MLQSNQLQRCGKCGAALSGYAPDGLCAACLLESAFEGDETSGSQPSQAGPLLAFKDYEILEELARGGMGVVYRARQISLNRSIAIKMILGGHLAEAADMQRFRAEAETAAQLQHPNIVAIHEVGEHAGQPFFSMDLVEGRNLAQLVRDEPLPSRKAAAYLKTIAEAVQYAHSRGVLHRDLKPSNILIDEHDQPRITDFGLAKRLTDSQPSTLNPQPSFDPHLTQTGQILGSPSFIPPEQAAGQKGALSPASDVYSLGAILYHVLTARPPFMAESLAQTLRLVAEQEPVMPCLLNASVSRDLETICIKCLEKDPKRRYGTAKELADELERFLRQEPIRARPVSVVGKVQRWCLRNQPLAVTGTVVVGLLVILAIGSPVAAFRINRERLVARANQKRAEVFARFLSQTLESAGPSVAKGRDKTLMMEILDNAASRVSIELTNQPEVEADVRLILGKTYLDLGQYTNALTMSQDALRLYMAHLGPKHIKIASILNNLGAILSEMGDLPAAEAYDREALEMKKALLGNEDPDVATSMSNLGFRLWNRGNLAGAEPLLQEALRIRRKKLSSQHPDLAESVNNLAMVLWSQGDFDGAEPRFREALAIFRKIYPGDHRAVATILNNVATVLRDLGRLDEAETMKREALAMRQKVLGPRHTYTAYSQNDLAVVLQKRGKLEEAESLHRQALAVLHESVGTNHQYVAEVLFALGGLLVKKGELANAEAMQRDALATFERALGKGNPATAYPVEKIAMILAVRSDLAQASTMLTNVLELMAKSTGREHPDLIPPLLHLAWVSRQRRDPGAAEALRRQALAIALKGGTYSIRALTDSSYDLADLLEAQRRYADAEPVLLELAAYLETRPEASQLFRHPLLERFARFYETWDRATPDAGKSAEAAAWKKRVAEFREKPATQP